MWRRSNSFGLKSVSAADNVETEVDFDDDSSGGLPVAVAVADPATWTTQAVEMLV